jgi:oligopeptide/dipeptide ABC transporter ATP-binding protein
MDKMTDNGTPLLEVRDLRTYFHTRDGVVKAVDGVDFDVHRGEVLGLVGESGCGKSVTSFSIMGLVGQPGKIESGSVRFDGRDLLAMSKKELRQLRGEHISMIFQQPQSSLNPVFRVGAQISEMFEIHRGMKKAAGEDAAVDMLKRVGIPDPEERVKAYPHEFSGGMAQRVMIAMALACEPELLIADEPTTALDVTIQAQILDLMRDLQRDSNTAVILITHDLGVVAEMADRVAVMYAGEIVEETDVETLFAEPKHPYTQGLIGSVPILGQLKDELDVIPGNVPNLVDLPVGCRFADRCQARVDNKLEKCTVEKPGLIQVGERHRARCWLYEESAE